MDGADKSLLRPGVEITQSQPDGRRLERNLSETKVKQIYINRWFFFVSTAWGFEMSYFKVLPLGMIKQNVTLIY